MMKQVDGEGDDFSVRCKMVSAILPHGRRVWIVLAVLFDHNASPTLTSQSFKSVVALLLPLLLERGIRLPVPLSRFE